MTEYEIVKLSDQRMRELQIVDASTTHSFRLKTLPTLATLLKVYPTIGLHLVLTPLPYTVDGKDVPEGNPVRVESLEDILTTIRLRREELNLGPHRLEEQLNLGFGYFRRIEKGEYHMSLKMLVRVCRALLIDVSVEPDPEFGPYASGLFSDR